MFKAFDISKMEKSVPKDSILFNHLLPFYRVVVVVFFTSSDTCPGTPGLASDLPPQETWFRDLYIIIKKDLHTFTFK